MSIGRVPGVTGIQPSIVDAKGDLIVATAADSVDRLAIGSANQVLTVDSSTATGLKWAATQTPAFVGCSVQRTNVSTVLTANATYLVAFNTEEYDTNAFHDNSTNNSRLTIPTGYAGKYLLTAYVGNALGTPGSYFELGIYRNGSQYTASGLREGRVFRLAPSSYLAISQVVSGSAGDYFEIAYQQNNGETVNMWFSAQFVYLGA